MKRRKGFTLLESVTAIVLVAIVAMAAALSFLAAKMWIFSAKNHYQAASVSREALENIVQTYNATGQLLTAGSDSFTSADGVNFYVAWDYPTNYTVDVTTSWTENFWVVKNRSVTLVHFVKWMPD